MAQRFVVAMTFVGLVGCVSESAHSQREDPTTKCRAAGLDGSAGTLTSALSLIDSLPRPLTLTCFIESLPRPLNVIGSTNDFSLQAAEPSSPRVLAIFDQLVVSWVPAGPGRQRLEFAEERPNARSVKAEVLLPMDGSVTPQTFEHMLHPGGQSTTCGGCHFDEVPEDVNGIRLFASKSLRVAPDEVVRVEGLRALHEACDDGVEPARCAVWNAMFAHGDVLDTEFPRNLPTVYD